MLFRSLKEDEEPYIIPDPGANEVIVKIKEESSMPSLPALTEGEEEEKAKPSLAKDPDSTTFVEEEEEPLKIPPPSNTTTTIAEEEYAGPWLKG